VGESEHSEANKRLLAAVVLLVLLFVGFSLVVYLGYNEKPNEKFWDWLIVVVGTLASFILGLTAGFFHLNRQNAATQRRRKAHLARLLKVELEDSKNRLTENTLTHIQPLILEEAVKGGLFCSGLTTEMLKLAKAYHKHNDHVTTLRAAGEPTKIELAKGLQSDTDEVLNPDHADSAHASS
jgi:hypothetical protein